MTKQLYAATRDRLYNSHGQGTCSRRGFGCYAPSVNVFTLGQSLLQSKIYFV
jgi:hypothetical protein